MFFSIILPTYNREKILPRAIKSVLKQSYEKWELIIIDDGSTDKTKDVVDKFCNKDRRVKHFYQSNKERSAARNYGIYLSLGRWICFLDSDDLCNDNHLEVFYSVIKKNNFQDGQYFSVFGIR